MAQRQSKMLQTRAELLDVKPKVLASRVIRRLQNIRAQIDGIGAAFEDIDQTVVSGGNELLAAFEEYEQTVKDSVEWLNQVPED